MNITVIGAGHVGLVQAAIFAEKGNRVICLDNDGEKISMLKEKKMPFFEPGLEEVVLAGVKKGMLSFSESIQEGVENSQILFICVGTPPKDNGEPNLLYVENVVREIGNYMNEYKLIVEKSTVPVETGEWIEKTIRKFCKENVPFDVACNPEFLREGQAVYDARKPNRIVIGAKSEKARGLLKKLYEPFDAPLILCDIKTAELIKHASNAFLSLKISYINAIAQVCDRVGADVAKVAEGMGLDPRIGRSFLNAGVGYGGFCFPKDLQAFVHIAEKAGYDFKLLKCVEEINNFQRQHLVDKMKKSLWVLDGKIIGILGLSFKPDTDDMRFAPSVEIIGKLQSEGARVCAYDPVSEHEAKKILSGVKFCSNVYEAAKDAEALVLLTEWKEFHDVDWKKIKSLMKNPAVFDGRNFLDESKLAALGFSVVGMGR